VAELILAGMSLGKIDSSSCRTCSGNPRVVSHDKRGRDDSIKSHTALAATAGRRLTAPGHPPSPANGRSARRIERFTSGRSGGGIPSHA
jgi:hypothetical protein